MSTPTIDALTEIIAAVSDRDRAAVEAQDRVVAACKTAHDLGVTQLLIAEAAGVSRWTVAKWLEGEK